MDEAWREGDVVEITKPPLTVVLWKWGKKYSSSHVNALARALDKFLKLPHQVVCITDDPAGLDTSIATLPLPYDSGRGNARRLWIFSDEAKMLGERVLQLDLDMVIVADITQLVNRPEPFVVWYCEAVGRIGFALNPSMMLLTTGTQPHVWEAYKSTGDQLVLQANREGCCATDQAVVTYFFTIPQVDMVRGKRFHTRRAIVPTWNRTNGVVGFRAVKNHPKHLPCGTRIVSFHGPYDPVDHLDLPWVKEYWQRLLESNDSIPTEVSHG